MHASAANIRLRLLLLLLLLFSAVLVCTLQVSALVCCAIVGILLLSTAGELHVLFSLFFILCHGVVVFFGGSCWHL